MKASFTTLFLIIITSISVVFAQNYEDEKEDISVLPFTGWQGIEAKTYEKIITEKILAKVIDSRKFNVISSDDAELKKIANELRIQLSGMVDESTAVEIGNRRGIKIFIVGNFTGNDTDYHRAVYDDDGDLEQDAYYTANISASIKLLDIETGKYTASTQATAYGRDGSERGAVNEALNRLAFEIYDDFRKYFLIQAYISGVNKSEIFIDRGYELGVKEGMTFEILDVRRDGKIRKDVEIPAGTPRVGIVKVTETEPGSAKALLMGPYKELMPGYLLREMKTTATTTATISKKTLNRIRIDRGRNFDIRSGQYYTVLKAKKSGNLTGKTKKVGLIYIYDTEENYSMGKILKGRYAFKEGMVVEQTTGSPYVVGASFAYGIGLNQRTIVPNSPSGAHTVNNGEPGSVSVETDFLERYNSLSNLDIYTFDVHMRDLLYNYTVAIGADFYSINDGELNGWAPKISGSYQIPLIPEFLYLSPGVEFGFGNMRQEYNEVNQVSASESDFVRDWSPLLGASLEGTMRVKNVLFFGKVSYKHLRFNSWEYRAETGEVDDEGNPETKFYSMPDQLVPYPNVRIGPVFMQAGIRIEIPID